MSYNKNIWKRKDRITKEKLNNIENGIYEAHDKIEGAINDFSSQIKDISIKKIYQFNSVANMKSYNLKEGEVCETLGYYLPNDGGRGKYVIKNNLTADEGYIISLNNGLFAELIIENNTVNFKQIGAKVQDDNNNRYDNKSYLELYVNKLKKGINHKLYIPAGVYYFSPYVITGNLGLNIEGDYDFSNGIVRGTILKPLQNGQTFILQLGSNAEYLTNFSINNLCFSSSETTVLSDSITINTGALESVGTALKLIHAQFGKVGDIHFTGIKGQAMNIKTSWEIDFNKLFFRAVNSRHDGVLVFDTVDRTLNEYPNISTCYFRYINFEAIVGDCIKFKKECKLLNSSFGVINVEDKGWNCGDDNSSWVTINSSEDNFNETTDKHYYVMNFESQTSVRAVNFKTIEMNNVACWYNVYNNEKSALDSVIKFGNYGDVSISINDINIHGFNKNLRIIHLLEGETFWYNNNIMINSIYSNNDTYNCYFDVKGLHNLKVNNIFNVSNRNTINNGVDFTPFSEIYHIYDDCGRGLLYYDDDSINNLKLVIKPITHLLSNGNQRNRTIGSLYVNPNAKIMFRAKADEGSDINIRFDGWGNEKSVTFIGDGNWHWYTIDFEGLFNKPTIINIKTHYNTKYNNINYYLDCFKVY